jgi:hypothetical protein
MSKFPHMILLILAAGVITSLGGFLIVRYGDARYQAGVLAGQLEQATTQAQTATQDASNFKRIENETKQMEPSAIDRDLLRLGIVRPD